MMIEGDLFPQEEDSWGSYDSSLIAAASCAAWTGI